MSVRDLTERERRFLLVALLPEIIQAIDEKFRRDIGLFLSAEIHKSASRLPDARQFPDRRLSQ